MKISTYQSNIRQMIEQRNGYLVLSTGLLVLCLVLSVLIIFLSGRERIVLIPPSMEKDTWISNHTASRDYLIKLTLSLSELTLNATPDNVDYQQEQLVRYIDPSYYAVLKSELVAEADRIKKDRIETSFFPVDIKVDTTHSEAIVTGDLKSSVGDTALPAKRVSYRFVYRINSFQPLITLFEEVKNA